MAVINYTETRLSNKLFIVSWENMAAGDTGQPFDARDSMVLSQHGYGTGDSVNLTIAGSNEVSAPEHVPCAIFNRNGSMFYVEPLLVRVRWYTPNVSAVTAGLFTMALLFQEV